MANHKDLKKELKDIKAGIVFLDIAKAFNCVDHDILDTILLHNGCSERVGIWFKSYNNRFQRVKVDGMLSDFVCLFVCGISLTSRQLVNELFPDYTRSCFSQVVLRRRGGDRIYEMRCLFVAVGPNARFIVLPHWDNMS